MELNEQKRGLIELLLPLCPFLEVDGTHHKAVLPTELQRTDVVLRIGRDPRVMGIPDLLIASWGFSATLSFQGRRIPVSVPWEAVSRGWVGEPFAGPIFVWQPPAVEALPDPPVERKLRVVKDS